MTYLLTALVFVPTAVALLLFALPRGTAPRVFRALWLLTSALELALVIGLWAGYDAMRRNAVRAARPLDPECLLSATTSASTDSPCRCSL